MNGLFQIFKTSQFVDIVNESDKEFVDDECLERNAIRADNFCNDDSAGHNAEIVRSSPGNTHSSSEDVGHNEYRTNTTDYEQRVEGS